MRNNIEQPYFYEKNFRGLDKEVKIYKYIPLEYIIKMFSSKQLIFGRVADWEDVYENFFLKQNLRTQQGSPIETSDVMDRCFGQSWTLLNESDAMWRIYSPCKMAIKVETTAEKLLDLLYDSDDRMADTAIGRVDYKSQREIDEWLNEVQKTIDNLNLQDTITESLFIKRTEFKHEEEVRIIKMVETSSPKTKSIVASINPSTLFDELVIDPRVDDKTFNKLKSKLITVGADPAKIKKSQLYTFIPHTIVF